MFSVSIKITKRQLAAAGAVLVLVFAGGLWLKAALADLRGASVPSNETVKIQKTSGKTNAQRVEFLASFGWEIEPEAEEIFEVMIPAEFDDVIIKYNDIQKEQGCDLQKYAGKRCKRYTYIVSNYPEHDENVRANLIVYGGKIIGGDICSLELDGFMHGFANPAD